MKTTFEVAASVHVILRIDEAQKTLADAMRRAIGERDTPRLTGIRITAGGGKSTAALRQLGVEKRYMDELGFMFSADYYVPTHRLGDELAVKAHAEGLDAVVEIGRSQPHMIELAGRTLTKAAA